MMQADRQSDAHNGSNNAHIEKTVGKLLEQPSVASVLHALLQERSPIHLVGGIVRDMLLDSLNAEKDLDIAMEPPVLPIARRVADRLGWAYFPLDEERDVARLVHRTADGQEIVCDITALRGDLITDLRKRDFTINAMAVTLDAEGAPVLVDVCGGQADLEARRLRPVSAESLVDDPIRLLRAVRMAVYFDLTIDDETARQIKSLAPSIVETSVERIRDELWKMLAAPRPHHSIELARQLGLLEHVLPEVNDLVDVEQGPPHHLDVYHHTLLAVEHAKSLRDWLAGNQAGLDPAFASVLATWSEELAAHFAEELAYGHTRADWLIWHALLHDTGKPHAKTVTEEKGRPRIRFIGHESISKELVSRRLRALRFARREIVLAEKVAAQHMRPHQLSAGLSGRPVSRRSAYRFFQATAIERPKDRTGLDVALLALADGLATGEKRTELWDNLASCVHGLLAFVFAVEPASGPPLLDGRVLMKELQVPQGPQVGRLLAAIAEAQAAGEVATQSEALALARTLINQEKGSQ